MDKVDHSEGFVHEVLETLTRMLYADLVPLLLEDPSLRALLPTDASSLTVGSPTASGETSSSKGQAEVIWWEVMKHIPQMTSALIIIHGLLHA